MSGIAAESLPVSYGALSTFEQASVPTAYDYQAVRAGKPPALFSSYNLGHACNTLILLLGASIFSLPWSYYEAGIVGGVVITWFASYISLQTALAMLSAQRTLYFQSGEVLDFPEIAAEFLGSKHWIYVIKMATTISCLGGCAGYLIFIAQLCSQELRLPLERSVFFLCIPITLLCWIRSFRELHVYTIFGVFAITLSVFAIMYDAFPVDHTKSHLEVFDLFKSFAFLGTATFLFTVHYCILSMGAEILNVHSSTILPASLSASAPSVDLLLCPITAGWILGTLIVTCLGLVGPLLYGNSAQIMDSNGAVMPGCENTVCQNIVLNLPFGRLRLVVVCVLVCSMMIAYPMLLAPAREHVEKWTLRLLALDKLGETNMLTCWSRNIIRTCLVALTAYIATRAPYFGTVLRTVGGFTDAFQSYVVSALVCIVLFRTTRAEGRQLYLYVFILVWGCGLMAFTLIQTVQSIMSV